MTFNQQFMVNNETLDRYIAENGLTLQDPDTLESKPLVAVAYFKPVIPSEIQLVYVHMILDKYILAHDDKSLIIKTEKNDGTFDELDRYFGMFWREMPDLKNVAGAYTAVPVRPTYDEIVMAKQEYDASVRRPIIRTRGRVRG